MVKIRKLLARYTLKNIRKFFTGTIRYYLPFIMRHHIKAQIVKRKVSAKRCLDNGSCLACGCTTPALFYANEACGLTEYPLDVRIKLTGKTEPCYDKMLSKKEFKTLNKN